MTELTFTIDAPTSGPTDADTLKEFLSELQSLTTKYGITTEFTSSSSTDEDWDWESPCPVCGSENFTVREVIYNNYSLAHGGIEFTSQIGYGEEPYLEVRCEEPECRTTLHSSPAIPFIGP